MGRLLVSALIINKYSIVLQMGACINMKEKPKKKATGQTKQNKEKALYKSKMIDKDAENDKPTTARKTQEPPSPLRPKTKRMTR